MDFDPNNILVVHTLKTYQWIMTFTIIGPFMLLTIPIKFFIGKEFALVLLDELRNKSISSKIDHLIKRKT